jgi:hypothetical protein
MRGESQITHNPSFFGGLMREGDYQKGLIRRIANRFPECLIIKNDAGYIQGIPDLLILNGDCWAMLEVKVDAEALVQPNQSYYVDMLNDMSFATFIYPENEEMVLDALQSTFGA